MDDFEIGHEAQISDGWADGVLPSAEKICAIGSTRYYDS